MRPGLLVLSGYNTRAVVALCRWAAEVDVPVHLVARDRDDPIYFTDYSQHVFLERSSPHLQLPDILGWIERLRNERRYSQVLLAPSTEFFNRVLLKHRTAIAVAGGIVPLVERALYEQISDKEAFAKLCVAHGIEVPATLQEIPDTFPFVAKPKTYGAAKSGQIKPYLISSPAELDRFRAREDIDQFFLQEFITGQSLYLLAHIARNGTARVCAQENLLQQLQGGSIILARSHDFHRSTEAEKYLRLLRNVGFHGLIMVEVRHCPRTRRYVMIEANPRLWGPFQFTLDQGLDLLTPLVADHGMDIGGAIPPSENRDFYFWSGGLAGHAEPTYHNYSAERFRQDRSRIAMTDLFNRPDSQRLFEHESAQPKAA
jgi:predicted ATP-grasp superfamily ATP-dependent carboligase